MLVCSEDHIPCFLIKDLLISRLKQSEGWGQGCTMWLVNSELKAENSGAGEIAWG